MTSSYRRHFTCRPHQSPGPSDDFDHIVRLRRRKVEIIARRRGSPMSHTIILPISTLSVVDRIRFDLHERRRFTRSGRRQTQMNRDVDQQDCDMICVRWSKIIILFPGANLHDFAYSYGFVRFCVCVCVCMYVCLLLSFAQVAPSRKTKT